MGDLPRTGLVYDDLQAIDDERHRYEIIDGELFVSPSPSTAHQMAQLTIAAALLDHVRATGGAVLMAPYDVYFASDTVVIPDVVYVTPEHRERVEDRFLRGAPDLVVEVASPSTRRIDLGRKLQLYQREGVSEYWFVDVTNATVVVHRLVDGTYAPPQILGRGQTLLPAVAPGFSLGVDEVFEVPGGSR